jgi:hypothetical protein
MKSLAAVASGRPNTGTETKRWPEIAWAAARLADKATLIVLMGPFVERGG